MSSNWPADMDPECIALCDALNLMPGSEVPIAAGTTLTFSVDGFFNANFREWGSHVLSYDPLVLLHLTSMSLARGRPSNRGCRFWRTDLAGQAEIGVCRRSTTYSLVSFLVDSLVTLRSR